MKLALRGKEKLGFVNENCPKSRYRGELAEQWEKCNAIVLSWIGSTVASELMPSIMFASDAKKIWSDFHERFDRSNLTRIYHLSTEIATMRQGTDSVTTYFSKMKDFWDELDILAPLSNSDCVEARPSIEHLKSQRLLQFLMGLNESYNNIRSNILARRPIVTVNEAYAIVTQEKSQRTLGVVENKEPLDLLAGKAQMGRPKTPGLVCEHCGYKGHLKENCYKIVDYLPDFKSKKKSGQQGGMWNNNNNFNQGQFRGTNPNNTGFRSYSNNTADERQVQGHFFTEEEYSQLMELLNKSSQEGCSSIMAVAFFPSFCVFSTLDSGKVMGICRENNGLYILKRGMESPLGVAVTKNEDMATLWHLRLGYPSVGAMKHIPLLKDKVIDKIQEEFLDGKTPYELLYGEIPKLEYLRVFGYLSYAGNLPRGDKLDARARRAVLLGYSDTQKGYKLCDLDTRTFFMSRDVSFRESTFPFKMGKACDDELLFVPITDTAGKTLQPEPPKVAEPVEDTLGTHADSADETSPM
ncbi:uncharacterized protein [Nicotiana sylvestris]|uniref:uncharacterized protein n=1 Tax=Nicotiana sylvestris TaxID=4096 RepID=UPI00388C9131